MILCVQPGENELVVKRSRFIASSYRIESRDDVCAVVSALKQHNRDARHVCYGYIADEKGDDFGYDDNGEPSGTAGKPIYSALAAANVRKSLIAVVRYFGGIKLGTGGLTRAYRDSATALIEKVGLVKAEKHSVYALICGGDEYRKFMSAARNWCEVQRIEYAENVDCTLAVSVGNEDRFLNAASAVGVMPVKTGEKYVCSEQ